MLEGFKASLSRFKRRAEGEFDVVIIDEFNRSQRNVKGSNVEVRTGFLYPKEGDLMQVARYCFGGGGSRYTPARVIRDMSTGLPRVYIDLFDWKIPQIRAMDEFYEQFKSPLSGEEAYKQVRQTEERFRRHGIDYELILVDVQMKELAKRVMSALKEFRPCALYDYQIGISPFKETVNGDDLFGEIAGLKRDQLIVQAVLHPLVGLPKVLVRKK